MEIMNLYISSKSKTSDSEISQVIKEIDLKPVNNFFKEYRVNKSLIKESLEQLVNRIQLKDIQIYLLLTHTFIHKKKRKAKVRFYIDNRIVSFWITCKEQINLLCSKIKRKDELIKMGFKFTRRELLKKFNSNKNVPLSQKETVKRNFYQKYLGDDKEAIVYFESFDVSRKGLKLLEKYSSLKDDIQQFLFTKYICSFTIEYILNKSESILSETTKLEKFIVKLLSRQHRHSLIVQDVINSLEQMVLFLRST